MKPPLLPSPSSPVFRKPIRKTRGDSAATSTSSDPAMARSIPQRKLTFLRKRVAPPPWPSRRITTLTQVRRRSLVLLLLLLALLLLPHDTTARKARITWVNGIAYHMDHMTEGEDFISQKFGGEPIYFCYNPTKQAHFEDLYGYLGDLTQAGTQKLGVITAEVNTLAQFLKQAVAAVGPRGVVVHIAHSQGALITALATKQLSALEMNQIEVLAFGGAAAIRKTVQTPFRRCVNYYAVNDPLLLVVPPAAQALRSGLIATQTANDADNEFVFLMPRLGDPIADHNLIGPTYAQALEWEGRRFRSHHRSLGYRILQPVWVAFWTFVVNVLVRQWHHWQTAVVQSFVQSALAVQKLWIEKVWKPLIVWIKVILQWMIQLQRNMTGGDKFVPVSTIALEE